MVFSVMIWASAKHCRRSAYLLVTTTTGHRRFRSGFAIAIPLLALMFCADAGLFNSNIIPVNIFVGKNACDLLAIIH